MVEFKPRQGVKLALTLKSQCTVNGGTNVDCIVRSRPGNEGHNIAVLWRAKTSGGIVCRDPSVLLHIRVLSAGTYPSPLLAPDQRHWPGAFFVTGGVLDPPKPVRHHPGESQRDRDQCAEQQPEVSAGFGAQ